MASFFYGAQAMFQFLVGLLKLECTANDMFSEVKLHITTPCEVLACKLSGGKILQTSKHEVGKLNASSLAVQALKCLIALDAILRDANVLSVVALRSSEISNVTSLTSSEMCWNWLSEDVLFTQLVWTVGLKYRTLEEAVFSQRSCEFPPSWWKSEKCTGLSVMAFEFCFSLVKS